jgi:hypothetical protein
MNMKNRIFHNLMMILMILYLHHYFNQKMIKNSKQNILHIKIKRKNNNKTNIESKLKV